MLMAPSAANAMAGLRFSRVLVEGAKRCLAPAPAGSELGAAGEWNRSAAFSLGVAGRDRAPSGFSTFAASHEQKLNEAGAPSLSSFFRAGTWLGIYLRILPPELNSQRARKSCAARAQQSPRRARLTER
jgi:hypothetical protein